MPPAQMYHYFEVNVKMKLLGKILIRFILFIDLLIFFFFFCNFDQKGLGKPSNVNKLNETAAIELGAELLGESIIFIVAVLTLTAEYYRQSKKSAAEAVAIEERWLKLERKVQDLELIVEKHGAEIRSLTRLIHSSDYKKTDRNSPEESRSKKIIKII